MTTHDLNKVLTLSKPVVFFDIEGTGVDPAREKIISLYAIKLYPDGKREDFEFLLNPGIAIPPGATAVHGITDDMVKDNPSFEDEADRIIEVFQGSDYAGFNIMGYDMPILVEELSRVNMDLPKGNCLDVFNIFRKKEERTLSAAVRFYCGRELEGAHEASADANATLDVFLAQLSRYPDIAVGYDVVQKYSQFGEVLDYSGWFTKDDQGEIIYGKGKSKGIRVKEDPGFAQWLRNQHWPTRDTKKWANDILDQIWQS